MRATYVPNSFSEENAKHDKAIKALKKYYEGKILFKELPGKNDEGCDLLMKQGNEILGVEIKTLAGCSRTGTPYSTFIVETFTDYEKKYLSGWRAASNLSTIIFFNLHTKRAYIYDATTLRSYVEEHLHLEQPSGTSTGQYNKANKNCSWGIKIHWACKEAGLIKEIDLKDYL